MTTTVSIKGMSCQHCVNAVAKALKQLPGITDVQVDLGKGRAVVDHDDSVSLIAVKKQIEQAGYEVD